MSINSGITCRMAALTTQSLTTPPITYAAATSGGDTFAWAPGVFVHLKNVNAATRTVTVAGQTACNQGFLHNKVYTVPANDELFIEPLDGALADGSGNVHLTYSAVVGLSLAVLTAS